MDSSPLSGLSFDSLIKYSFNYSEDPNFENYKESENIPLFLNFLRQIWTYLTDSSLYNLPRGKTKEGLVPFMFDESTRELVANNILKFLDKHREELSPTSRESETPSSVLSHIAQGHLLTCFKLLSSFIMYNEGELDEGLVQAQINLARVFMKMVPQAIDLSILLDFLTDSVKTLSPENCLAFSEFLFGEAEYFSDNLADLESKQNQRLAQTCGAKLIGLVKGLETSFERSYLNFDYSHHVFKLRSLLTECLPVSHLGICNRQSLESEHRPVNKASLEEWSKMEKASLRTKCEGLTDYEINAYESVITPASANFTSNQIYDIKMYMSKIGDKTEKTQIRSMRMPSYEVYSNFCDIYTFIQNPEIILVKTQDYVEDLNKQYSNVLGFVNTLTESSNDNDDMNTNLFEFEGGIGDFVNKSMNLKFWGDFLVLSCLSFQNLKLFHRKATDSTTYDLLKDKVVNLLETIEKNVWTTIHRIRNLPLLAKSMVQKEQNWINWKLNGCNDEVNGVEGNKVEMLKFNENFENFGDEGQDGQGEDEGDQESESEEEDKMLTTMRELEKLAYEFGDEESTIGVNFVPVVPDLKLDREATEWYLPETGKDYSKMSCDEQLAAKFEDYCRKLEMDEDPENDIAEQEKSKYDPLFKLRFIRLFAMNHLEKLMELSNEDIASGSIEPLLRLVRNKKEEEIKESSPKRQKR